MRIIESVIPSLLHPHELHVHEVQVTQTYIEPSVLPSPKRRSYRQRFPQTNEGREINQTPNIMASNRTPRRWTPEDHETLEKRDEYLDKEPERQVALKAQNKKLDAQLYAAVKQLKIDIEWIVVRLPTRQTCKLR